MDCDKIQTTKYFFQWKYDMKSWFGIKWKNVGIKFSSQYFTLGCNVFTHGLFEKNKTLAQIILHRVET